MVSWQFAQERKISPSVEILLHVDARSPAFGGNLARSHQQGPASIVTKPYLK